MAGEIMLFGANRKTRRTRKHAKRAHRANTTRRRRSPKRKVVEQIKVFGSNPKRRRKVRAFKRNPKPGRARRAVGRARAFLGGAGVGNVFNMVKVATIAASGGVLLDIAFNYIPVPVSLKTGPVSHLVKGAGAIGLAMLAKRVVGPKMANELAMGALTVVLYGALRAAANTAIPSLKLGLYDDLGLYLNGGMHIEDGHLRGMDGLGYYGSGLVSGSAIAASGQPMELQGEFRSF